MVGHGREGGGEGSGIKEGRVSVVRVGGRIRVLVDRVFGKGMVSVIRVLRIRVRVARMVVGGIERWWSD